MKKFYDSDQALVNPPIEESTEFAIEDFFTLPKYTPDRMVKAVEYLAQVMFFGSVAAHRSRPGFGKHDPTAKELGAVATVRCSTAFVSKSSGVRKATLLGIRDELEAAGLFAVWNSIPKWQGRNKAQGKDTFRSEVTALVGVDLVAIAQLLRRMVASIVQRAGFEPLKRDHKWGFLAAMVFKLTGCSLFSLDDEYETSEESRQQRKEQASAQSIAELANCQWAGAEYRALVSDRLAQQFGPDWSELLPY